VQDAGKAAASGLKKTDRAVGPRYDLSVIRCHIVSALYYAYVSMHMTRLEAESRLQRAETRSNPDDFELAKYEARLLRLEEQYSKCAFFLLEVVLAVVVWSNSGLPVRVVCIVHFVCASPCPNCSFAILPSPDCCICIECSDLVDGISSSAAKHGCQNAQYQRR
jgi:hypothetical protein